MVTPLSRPFDAAVFDLDGTLVDSIDDLADAMNAALGACGFAPRSVAECRQFVGDGARRFVERAVVPREGGLAACPADKIEAILDGFRRHYADAWARKTRPYDGIPELLDALTARGVRLAVLSNKIEEFTVAMVRGLLPRWPWAVVRGERPGVPPKPDPRGALETAAELGVDPARVLYFGDTGTDMRTAISAGFYPIGVSWGFRAADELRQTGARTIIAHPLDALALLEPPRRVV